MDYETVEAEVFGASLRGMGLNILVRDVEQQVTFLTGLFGMAAHQVSKDFAILTYAGQIMQLHADHTYGENPLLGLVPEAGARGVGAEFRLYESDPDDVAARAEALGGHILQAPTNKPHGLREVYVLCENGYAWVASKPL
ncbi:Glyoxalase-like domain protein [Roseovarius albus]|uniref:Glyoxalase-like domain protein n=1 Tax=Roseovarius albus TaxID=1247867 RepID=A0A1X6ZNP7_9RHOB|nr:glyoxalase [Roseovarius albus]SLN56592.1 Glyoxalase-like domain protein [Roseovarius albus]